MKKCLIIILTIVVNQLSSQIQEITGGIGFSVYHGDLSTSNASTVGGVVEDFFKSKNTKMSYSLAYRYNFPSYFSLGINYYHLYLSGYDSDNPKVGENEAGYGRLVRNLSFHTAVNELYIDARFEPLRTAKKWGKSKLHISPYLGTGIGLFSFNPKAFTKNGTEVELQPLGTEGQGLSGYAEKYSRLQVVIPVNIGVRVTPKSRLYSLSLDLSYNHTFTDYLDDVSTVYPNYLDYKNAYQIADPTKYSLVTELSDRGLIQHAVGEQRGGSKYKDFFVTGQIKFSYYIFNKAAKTYYKCCDF